MTPTFPSTFPLLLLALLASFVSASDDSIDFFESKVRPLLVKHCYSCHSGSAKKVEANLRLDHRSLILKGGDSGPAIQVNDPNTSLMLQAVQYETFEMPPSGKLPAEEIEILRKWLQQGAVWPNEPVPEMNQTKEAFDLAKRLGEHWAWQLRTDHPIPKVASDGWSNNSIDPFVLHAMKDHGLSPNDEAERSTLIRRLYLDLVGIPPSLAQLDEHLHSSDPSWYETMVDQLLASPQFGVRFGRHWLDLVRYAESRGHEFDEDVPGATHYRDYVVRAINLDLPYDQFVTEQIAGDLLPEPRIDPARGWNESLLGTGFWHLGEWVHSPVDSRKDETDRFDNMIDVFSKSMLGLTVACARCHDHKFDAIGTADYYALAGFLKSSHYRMVRFETERQHQKIEQERFALREGWNQRFKERFIEAFQVGKSNPAVQEKWVAKFSERHPSSEPGKNEKEKNWKVALPLPTNDPRVRVDYSLTSDQNEQANTPWFVEGPGFGSRPVLAGSVDLDMSENPKLRWQAFDAAHFDPFWSPLKSSVESINKQNQYSQVSTSGRTLITKTFEMNSGELSYLIRGQCQSFVAVDSMRLLAGPLHGETRREFKEKDPTNEYRWVSQPLKRYQGKRLSVEFSPIEGRPFEVVQIIDGPPPAATSVDVSQESLKNLFDLSNEKTTPIQQLVIGEAFQVLSENAPEILGELGQEWNKDREAWKLALDRLASKTDWNSRVAMAMIDGSGENHPILIRGSHENDGPIVERRFLEALHGNKPTSVGSGRLQLAKEVTDPSNPLTARVVVNRLWHHLLGRGIVATTDDFGVQGQRPTHPELLDHLASQLIQHNWSIKQLVRTIVQSQSYKISSVASTKSSELDPDNRWLSHARVRRLEAEAIRDSLMSIADRLDSRLEGNSVPVHLTEFLEGRGRPGKSGPADGDSRRSLFISIRRNFLVPMMTTFDAPNPFSSMGRRNVSSVPAQSLMLLNDPFLHQLSKQWSEAVLKGSSHSGPERLDRMYLAAFSRLPTSEERSAALAFIDETTRSSSEQEAWQNLAHVLMNMKELILRF